MKYLLIAISIMASISEVNLKAKVCLLGAMVKYLMVNGRKDLNMDMVYGQVPMELKNILVNGLIVKLKVLVYTLGPMETNMKANGNLISAMEVDQIFFRMVIPMSVNIFKDDLRVLDSILGQMDLLIQVNLLKVLKMGRASGKESLLQMQKAQDLINMKVVTCWTKSQAGVFLTGKVVICMQATMSQMNDMVSVV